MFPDQSSVSCSTEVSCSGAWIIEFGFVTMPFMALSTFLLISVLFFSFKSFLFIELSCEEEDNKREGALDKITQGIQHKLKIIIS